ncbi:DUF1552 domain-containing protein [Vibrio coralliilyticus]|uniref:DUF1552 domain-containing protein n=1 Tax=Vibrio coralliilyticus TaxID=190893 RepID=UPI001E44650B|nr:DUF1552 domain-containing protein [Vibrio coralliilyticus]MCC2525588.1 DUF1552 domain-containing protein [Vibrio coralliilyticus]
MLFLKNRRRFLNAAVSASVLTPLSLSGLTRIATAASTGASRTKVVFFVIGDGFATDSFKGEYNKGLWFPHLNDATNTSDTEMFTFNEVSKELAAYRSQSLYLQGIILGGGNAGHGGWAEVLRDKNKSHSSIDVILGETMPGTDPSQRAIFAGPHAVDSTNWFVSWDGTHIRRPEGNPRLLFDTVFGSHSGSSSPSTSQTSGGHLFDPIHEDIRLLRSKLSGTERQKLDVHLDSVEQVISDMGATVPPSGVCNPTQPNDNPIMSAEFRNEVQASHHQVVATALSCGISRVATIQVGRSADQVVIKEASTSANPHDLAHRYRSEQEWKACRQWYARQAKLFLDELARLPDPDVPSDSLLDHTLVVLTSEMSDGAPEHQYNQPMLLVGGMSGLLNNGSGQGRYYNIQGHNDRHHSKAGPQVDQQRIWATLAQSLGTTVPYSGNISPVPDIFSNVT